MTPKSVPYQNV